MRKISAAFLLYPGFQLLDLAGPTDAFDEVCVLSGGAARYDIMTIGTTRGAVRSSSGIEVRPDRTIFDPCPAFDSVLVPGGLGVFDVLEDQTVSEWLVAQSRSSRRLAAICNGGFALGAAGLLNERTVSTHWMDAERMARMFPRAKLEADRIFVKDGAIYTTAGVTAGIDLSLLLIEEDFGRQMALDVARYLIVPLRRAGGQSQFSPLLNLQASTDTVVAEIQQYILANLHVQHDAASLAAQFHVSSRHLARVFGKATGMSPVAFLRDARIEAVRRLLETTDLPLKTIAVRCGFQDAEQLRRLFLRRLGLGPSQYKQQFDSSSAIPR